MLIPFCVVCVALLYIIGLTVALIVDSINAIKAYSAYIDGNYPGNSVYSQLISLQRGYLMFYIILAALAAVAFAVFALCFARTVFPRVKAARLAAKEGSMALFPTERGGALAITCYCLVFVALLVGIYMMASHFGSAYRSFMSFMEDSGSLFDDYQDVYYDSIRYYITYITVFIAGMALSAAAFVAIVFSAVKSFRINAQSKCV